MNSHSASRRSTTCALCYFLCVMILVSTTLSLARAALPVTEAVWLAWEDLPLLLQLQYLVEDYELGDLRQEYSAMLALAPAPAGGADADADAGAPYTHGQASLALHLHHILQAQAEFQDPEVSNTFFHSCDTDGDGALVFDEYLVCRGEHDVYGSPSDVSEWPLRADVVLGDFEDEMMKAAGVAAEAGVAAGAGVDAGTGGLLLDDDGMIIDE